MKTHCRCRNCRDRKKLNKHPLEYFVQPRCQCGARDWIKDAYRHRVELPLMRQKKDGIRCVMPIAFGLRTAWAAMAASLIPEANIARQ